MTEISEHRRQEIRSLVEIITKRSIGQDCPKNLCFSTSYVLSLFLNCKGISNTIISGNKDNTSHFWLNLLEYDGVILDATLRQFDDKQDKIYIDKISDNYITHQYEKKCYSFNEWVEVYERWCTPEFNTIGERHTDEFIRRLITHNLINASILNHEVRKLGTEYKCKIAESYFYQLYFIPIQKWLKEWKDDEILLTKIKANNAENEFTELLSRMGNHE